MLVGTVTSRWPAAPIEMLEEWQNNPHAVRPACWCTNTGGDWEHHRIYDRFPQIKGVGERTGSNRTRQHVVVALDTVARREVGVLAPVSSPVWSVERPPTWLVGFLRKHGHWPSVAQKPLPFDGMGSVTITIEKKTLEVKHPSHSRDGLVKGSGSPPGNQQGQLRD
jgi:hypothetical protein